MTVGHLVIASRILRGLIAQDSTTEAQEAGESEVQAALDHIGAALRDFPVRGRAAVGDPAPEVVRMRCDRCGYRFKGWTAVPRHCPNDGAVLQRVPSKRDEDFDAEMEALEAKAEINDFLTEAEARRVPPGRDTPTGGKRMIPEPPLTAEELREAAAALEWQAENTTVDEANTGAGDEVESLRLMTIAGRLRRAALRAEGSERP